MNMTFVKDMDFKRHELVIENHIGHSDLKEPRQVIPDVLTECLRLVDKIFRLHCVKEIRVQNNSLKNFI